MAPPVFLLVPPSADSSVRLCQQSDVCVSQGRPRLCVCAFHVGRGFRQDGVMSWRVLGRHQQNSRVVGNKEEDQRQRAPSIVSRSCVSGRFSSTWELFVDVGLLHYFLLNTHNSIHALIGHVCGNKHVLCKAFTTPVLCSAVCYSLSHPPPAFFPSCLADSFLRFPSFLWIFPFIFSGL